MTDIRIARKRRISSDPFLFFATFDNLNFQYIHVAQQVERPAVNRMVEGSSPSAGAIKAVSRKETGTLCKDRRGRLEISNSFKPSIIRPHGITAIMPACRAGDRGSTPLEVAND